MNITIFSTTNCGVCHAVMQWLDKQGITYDNKVVDEDPSAMDAFMSTNDGMIGTPLTIIENGDKVSKIAGFDLSRLKSALN